jgi:hypothetical protein
VGERGEGLSCDRSLFISSVAQGDRGVIGMMGQPGFPGLPGHMGLPVRFFFFLKNSTSETQNFISVRAASTD